MRRAGVLAGCAIALASWTLVAACGGDDGGNDTKISTKGDGGNGKGDAGTGASGGNGDAGSASGGTGTASDAKLESDAKSKLMTCKLWDPKGSASDTSIRDDYDRCSVKCVIAASCEELKELTCADEPSLDSSFLGCVGACSDTPADGYKCSDGSRIAHVAVCDGFEDCEDGADEQGCKSYSCKDGEKLDQSDVECDGFEDCMDGSDETGCANVCG